MDKLDVFNIAINIGTYREFLGAILENAQQKKSNYTCVANVHMLVEAYHDMDFANVVKNAHIITPDGLPLTWAIRRFYGIQQERVAGMDLLPDLLEQAQAKAIPVFFYGGPMNLLEKTRSYLATRYPGLPVAGLYSPPFRKLSEEEEAAAIRMINESGAQIVFVALGCPKQEKWMASMANRINAGMIGVGGALSVLIGKQKRAPRWMQKAGLEWSFRLLQEPNRLFKRYAVTNSFFIYLLLKAYLQRRFFHRAHHHTSRVDFHPEN